MFFFCVWVIQHPHGLYNIPMGRTHGQLWCIIHFYDVTIINSSDPTMYENIMPKAFYNMPFQIKIRYKAEIHDFRYIW